jgi:hypothetical protein
VPEEGEGIEARNGTGRDSARAPGSASEERA